MTSALSLGSGLLVGVLMNIGLGPVTILALTRRLRSGIRAGMEVGVACSVLDGVYCFAAAEAASFMTSLLSKYRAAMTVIGSLVLIGVAVGLFRQSRTLEEGELFRDRNKGHTSALISTFLLFVSNPAIPVFWLAVAHLALSYGLIEPGPSSAFFFALGIGLGGVIRYVILMRFVLKSADRIEIGLLKKAIFVLALVLLGIAAYGLGGVFVKVRPPGIRASMPQRTDHSAPHHDCPTPLSNGLGKPEIVETRFQEIEIGFENLRVQR